jgi:hypothetical protein
MVTAAHRTAMAARDDPIFRQAITHGAFCHSLGVFCHALALHTGAKIAKPLKSGVSCVWHD